MTSNSSSTNGVYDRDKEIEAFQNTKLGVKGLVDSGITRIPRIFHHPPETLVDQEPLQPNSYDHPMVPIIDLSGQHEKVVQQLRDASAKFGFFQVINHGISASLLDRVIGAVKAVHELQSQQKMLLYRQDFHSASNGLGFYSNFDSIAKGWRDTFGVHLGPIPVNPSEIPDVCRNEVIQWDKEVQQLGEKLMGLLSEGLGLSPDKLTGMAYIGRRTMVGQYYPHCPEPNKTIGIAAHTDPVILTVLLQDQVGGLQVKYDGKWIDLKPLRGALVVNVGDLLQMISNEEYRSGEHRVCANPFLQPRASIAVFFSSGIKENMYEPLPELVSSEGLPLFDYYPIGLVKD